MRSLMVAADGRRAAPTRIVCLPGAFETPEQFIAGGFADRVRERALPIDLCFVDPELESLDDRQFLAAMHDSIVQPARLNGCRALWLAGISLGGFLALRYAAEHADDLAGVCVLAPYLGNRMVTDAIARGADDAGWREGPLALCADERAVWNFIHAPHRHPHYLYLGYGREDRFAAAHRLMAAALPGTAVDVVPGGHDWVTWARLWENFLSWSFA